MGVRLQSTFYARESGTAYTISVYDESYASTVIDFTTDEEGFVISYQGEGEDMKVPVLTSKCEVNILVDKQAIEDFITDLNTAYEGRFRLKITSGSDGVWYGHVLADLVQIEDMPIAQLPIFRLAATDGIKRLQKIAYKDAAGPYTGEESITQHLVNCIGFIGLTDLMTEFSYVLKSVTNWRPANRIAGDDMDHTYFDHRALYQIDERGNYKYPSVYKVIEMLCFVFHAKFLMADGAYWFIQHNEYENNTISPDEYAADKTALGATVVDSYHSVDSTFTGKFGNGYYTFFPPLNIAQVNYIHFGYVNLARGYYWDEASQPTIPESPTVYTIKADTRIYFKANYFFEISYSGTRPAYIKFGLTFNVGSDYLKSEVRSSNPGSGVTIWNRPQEITATGSDTYELGFLVNVSPEVPDYSEADAIEFTTIAFPNEGAFSFTLDYIGAYDVNGNPIASGITIAWSFSNVEVSPIPNGDVQEWRNTRSVTAFNSTTGNSERTVVNTIIGQEFGYGRLRIDTTGGGKIDGVDWGVGGTVSSQSLEELLAIEMIRTQAVPIKKMVANFSSATYSVVKSIRHNSNTWIWWKGKWYANKEYFAGEWYLLNTTGTTSGNETTNWIISEVDSEGNDVTTIYPVGPGGGVPDPEGESTESTAVNSVLDILFPRTADDIFEGDTVTSIPITARTVADEFKAGQTITVIDPYTGAQQQFTVTANTQVSDTSISVTSDTADFDFPLGSWIITSQEQQAANGGGSAAMYAQEFTTPGTTLTVTANGGNLPANEAAISVFWDNGQWISPNYYTVSGSDITLGFAPSDISDMSIWVRFTA